MNKVCSGMSLCFVPCYKYLQQSTYDTPIYDAKSAES